jgi:GT2 family glycosyltransferase
MYQREAFLEAGGFDENFFTYFEDVDLGFRLRLMGHRCYYVCDAVVDHVGWGTTQRASAFSLYYGHRNLVWSFFKNMPWPLFWRFLPHHLLQNVFSLIWFTLQGKGGTIFRAKWNALAGLPRVWRQRKAIQKKTRVSMEDLLGVMDRTSTAPWMKIWMRARG